MFEIINKYGVPQGSILGSLLFVCYINALPKIFENNVKSVLRVDDASNYNYLEQRNDINTAFVQLSEWFNVNLLTLNYNKTQYIQSRTKAVARNKITVSYDNFISSSINITFLRMIIERLLTWKAHMLRLLPKLSKARQVMRTLKAIMSVDSLQTVCQSYFHSLII